MSLAAALKGWTWGRIALAGLLALLMLEIDWGDCSIADPTPRPVIVTIDAPETEPVALKDPYPWYCDVEFETTYKAYYYSAGGYWVAAGPWHDYDAESSWPTCDDINLEIWNTGSAVVRTLACPASGGCYVVQPNDGWGSLSSWPGPSYGVSMHNFSMPCCENMTFRIETRHFTDPGSGVAENLRLAF